MWRDMWAPGIAKKERTPESRWHKSTWSFANVHAQEGHDVCSHCTRLSFNALQHMTFFLWNVKDQRLIVIVPVGDTGNRLVWTVLVSKGWRGRRQTAKTSVMCDRAANEAACRMAPGLLTGVVQGHIDSIETTADSNSFQIKRQRFDWLARGDASHREPKRLKERGRLAKRRWNYISLTSIQTTTTTTTPAAAAAPAATAARRSKRPKKTSNRFLWCGCLIPSLWWRRVQRASRQHLLKKCVYSQEKERKKKHVDPGRK